MANKWKIASIILLCIIMLLIGWEIGYKIGYHNCTDAAQLFLNKLICKPIK